MSNAKIGTIRALLAKAESSEFESEAEALRERAFQLMAKFGIEQAMLASKVVSDLEATKVLIVIKGPYHARRVMLLTALAKAMRCRTVVVVPVLKRGQKTPDSPVYVYGMPSDVERVKLMFESLDLQMADALTKSLSDKPARVHGRTWSVNFISSFASEVYRRVNQAERDAESSEVTHGSGKFEVVLADNESKVHSLFEKENPNSFKTTHSSTSSSAGWSAGSKAGANAALGNAQGVGGGRLALGYQR